MSDKTLSLSEELIDCHQIDTNDLDYSYDDPKRKKDDVKVVKTEKRKRGRPRLSKKRDQAEYQKEWRLKNQDRKKAYNKEYYQKTRKVVERPKTIQNIETIVKYVCIKCNCKSDTPC